MCIDYLMMCDHHKHENGVKGRLCRGVEEEDDDDDEEDEEEEEEEANICRPGSNRVFFGLVESVE